jgi:hypothetical protein
MLGDVFEIAAIGKAVAEVEDNLVVVERQIAKAVAHRHRVMVVDPIDRRRESPEIAWKAVARSWRWEGDELAVVVPQMKSEDPAVEIVNCLSNRGFVSKQEG